MVAVRNIKNAMEGEHKKWEWKPELKKRRFWTIFANSVNRFMISETLFDLPRRQEKLAILQGESKRADLWQDPQNAGKILKMLKQEESELLKISDTEIALQTLQEMVEESDSADGAFLGELSREADRLSEAIHDISLATYFSGEHDHFPAIITISAGAGGTDAQDWAQILLRMYTRYTDMKKDETEVPDISYGEEAGIKGAVMIVRGPHAYGRLHTERGVHRLVRISPFNAEGKRQTSFAMVDVIPEVADEVEFEIGPKDLRVDTYRASGPGGQHVNKTDSAVRITHIPTGTVSQCQTSRSQHKNREAAMRLLKAKLFKLMQEEQKEKLEELRGGHTEIAWGNQIRSYVFHPYTMVKDHRTGHEIRDVKRVIDGDLDGFIEAYLQFEAKAKRK